MKNTSKIVSLEQPTSSQPVCGTKLDRSCIFKWNANKLMILTEHIFFHPNLKPFPTVITEQEMTPNPAEWVSDVLFIFTNRVTKLLWTGSLLGLEGWRRHCAVSLCDYHWLWGEESILVWGWVLRAGPSFQTLCTSPASKCHSSSYWLPGVSTSSWGCLWLRPHDDPSRLAWSHAGQDRHSHRLCSADAQPVDGGPWTGGRGGGWRPVLDNCRRGADGFSGSIPGGFLSSCS